MNLRKIITVAGATGILLSGGFAISEEYFGEVAYAITLDNNTINVKVKKGTVREILKAQNIELGQFDRVEPGLDTKVEAGSNIEIFRARDITIIDGGVKSVRKTTYKKVEDILKELNITLGENDKVTPTLAENVAEVDTIKITRITKSTETKKEEVKFETVEEKDDTKYVDEREVKTAGQNGEKEVTVETVKEDGKVVTEKTLFEKVTKEATKEVVVVGTKVRANGAYVSNNTQGSSYASSASLTYSGALPNGNTANSADAQYAAAQMEARTGVSASTWKAIIARESNGQASARNASGASGLFQTMPGWGSTSTVNDQINAAVKAYKNQGLRAWGVR